MKILKLSCSFITKASCIAYTCLSLAQSPIGASYTKLESVLIISFLFSGLAWLLLLSIESFSDTINQTAANKVIKHVNDTRRGANCKGDKP